LATLKTVLQLIGLFPQVYKVIKIAFDIIKKQKEEKLLMEQKLKLEALQKAKKESDIKNAAENYIDSI
jgi:hypothetical protein